MSAIQGAYCGITTGLILTLWVGIGAQIYKPPVLGPEIPPMSIAGCPYVPDNRTELFTSTTYYPPQFFSTDSVDDK